MLRIEAITRHGTQVALFEAASAINENGGWVTDHKLYSNVQAMIAFEIPIEDVTALYEALADYGFEISSPQTALAGEGEVSGQIALTIANDEPELHRNIPAFG